MSVKPSESEAVMDDMRNPEVASAMRAEEHAAALRAPSTPDPVRTALADTEEKELFAAATKIDLASALRKYANLMEAQAKLIAWLVNNRAAPQPVGNPLGSGTVSDEAIEQTILSFARRHGRLFPMSYDSGPYEITKATSRAMDLARAILSLVPAEGAREGWQLIETAPKYDDVLVWVPFTSGGGMRQIARYDHDDGGWIDDNDDKMSDAYQPTLWQPLPASPVTRPHQSSEAK